MCRVRPIAEAELKAGKLNCTRIRDDKSITIKVDMVVASLKYINDLDYWFARYAKVIQLGQGFRYEC